MAWRDSRGSRKRLSLYLLSMALGVAALVAINGFGANLEQTVDDQSKELLGADLAVEHNQPFADSTQAMLDTLGAERAQRVTLASMAYFPQADGTRLVTVRAGEPGYPFYGAIESDPPEAARTYHDGSNAIVESTLLEQFGIEIGDSLRLGGRHYQIAGTLERTPRESAALGAISPRVYIPRGNLDEALLDTGSRVEREFYLRFDDEASYDEAVSAILPHAQEHGFRVTTVDEAADDWGSALTSLYRFLSLVGFVALLLGSLGVASAVHVYVRRRVESIAVLRCLGARSARTFRIYLTQAGLMGLIGAVVGSVLGVGIQGLVPQLLADFLPVEVQFAISWRAIGLGLGIGLGVTLLFALLPLLRVRGVSPMRALRSTVESTDRPWRDPLYWGVAVAIAAGVAGFAVVQAPTTTFGLGYAAGVAVVFGLLAAVAKGIMVAARRFAPTGWSYPWRQGLANLYRPQNQTAVLMLAIGLGTFLIMTLFLAQRTLLEEVQLAEGDEEQPNIVLFDIQPEQMEGVANLVEGQGLPVMDRVPIITMDLEAVQGLTIDEIRDAPDRDLSWAHTREYRSTYRSELSGSERIVEGEFVGNIDFDPWAEARPVPISIEADIKEDLGVALGDTLTFDVQGVSLDATISSVREVDWRRVQTNFFVVFPEGVLENAPQMNVLLSRGSEEASAALQSQVVQEYPNVSAIDLSLVLSTVDRLFSNISFVVQVMALFSILVGLLVLVGAIAISRYQRIEESVLLKTLGAARSTVIKIMTIEYLFLGLFAALTGITLALAANWGLSYFVFEGPFVLAPEALIAALVIVSGLTILIGWLNSRDIYDRPPLEVLREEV